MRIVPAGFSRSSRERGQLGVDLVEARTHGPQQALARLGRRDTARGAGQEPKAEPRFEAADRVAQRRLRDSRAVAAARVKLRSRATARKAIRSLAFSRFIHKSRS